ncbi:cytochrome c oxidase assembly protein [Arthrobacter crystallopoietes]|uniref:cytochrome c oxidase assembly protein n=1 Tax=Crystallibacter crystallopoietes TaxID=37928 RepID=UPI0011116060|nr:cytochrome c oxidase assembly protein [Arthrobacter crystallopoietes]
MKPLHDTATHTGGHAGDGVETILPLAVLVLLAAGYLVLAARRRKEPLGWSSWRTASFLTGTGLLALALTPALSPFPAGDFRGHMYQHLLIGMYAPLALVLSAPVTLALRSLPRRHGRIIGRALRSPPIRVLAHPVTALILNLGGLTLLYFTPLYTLTTQSQTLHHLVHLHFLAAGYLFAYAIAGPDPAPHRPTVPARLVILGVAIAGHAVLAQLLYAGLFIRVPVPVAELRGAGDMMYYTGDIAELLLALALITTWRPQRIDARTHGAAQHT